MFADMNSIDKDYVEALIINQYEFEIERKDKILSSVSLISSPTTLAIGGVVYLIKDAAHISINYDLLSIFYYLFILSVIIFVVLAFSKFSQLLGGETYGYIPHCGHLFKDASDIADFFSADSSYNIRKVRDEMRNRLILQYAEAARLNCEANDKRLAYRQSVYKFLTLAVIFETLAFAAGGLHNNSFPRTGSKTHAEQSVAPITKERESGAALAAAKSAAHNTGYTASGPGASSVNAPGSLAETNH